MKVEMTLVVDLGESFINPDDQEERDWLFNGILKIPHLHLHSNEIGDTVGEIIEIISCKESPKG